MDNHTLGLDVALVGDRRKVEADGDLGLRVESIGGFHKQPALADVLHSANAEVRDGPALTWANSETLRLSRLSGINPMWHFPWRTRLTIEKCSIYQAGQEAQQEVSL